MSEFLENLKKSVETGDFNSDAAKKIIEIDKLADEKVSQLTTEELTERLADRVEEGGVKTVSEDEIGTINSDYDKKMQEIKERDLVLQQIATLKNIEDTVMLSIYDMRDYIKTLEESIDAKKPAYADLFAEIEKIKAKYNFISF